MYEALAISDLRNMDTSTYLLAFLLEGGREGLWLTKDAADYAAELVADVTGGMVLRSIFDEDKVLVRHWNGAIDPAWWGVSPSKTASQNSALLNECLATAAVSRERHVMARAGQFDISDMITVPRCVSFEAQGSGMGGSTANPGPTVFHCATEGVVIEQMDYSLTSGFDLRPAPGYTPSVAILTNGRGVTIGGHWYIGAFETCVNVGDRSGNLQQPKILGGHIVGCVNGVIIKQYGTTSAWATSQPYAVGSKAHDTTATYIDYECSVPHTSPGSGSFAAARAANPAQWKEAFFAYGDADINSGYLGPIDIHNASGIGIGFYNANGWTLHNPKVQDGGVGGYGMVFDHQARGNKGMVYLEKNGTDIHVGTRCHTNEIDICTLVPYPSVSYAPGAKASNTIRTRHVDGSGVYSWRVV